MDGEIEEGGAGWLETVGVSVGENGDDEVLSPYHLPRVTKRPAFKEKEGANGDGTWIMLSKTHDDAAHRGHFPFRCIPMNRESAPFIMLLFKCM